MLGQSDTLPIAITLAAVFAFPLSLFLLWLYRRAVLRSMNARSPRPPTRVRTAPAAAQRPDSLPPLLELVTIAGNTSSATKVGGGTLYWQAIRRPWHAATVYGVAGLLFALVMDVAQHISSINGFLPIRFLILFWMKAWPVVLAVNLIAASTRRIQIGTTVAYFSIFCFLGAIILAKSPNVSLRQLILLWSANNLLPTLMFMVFLRLRIRAVGPQVFTVMTIALAGAPVVLNFLQLYVLAGERLIGFATTGAFISILVTSFVLFVGLGWLLLMGFRLGYESKKMSDQSVALDSMWLLVALLQAVPLAFEGPIWVLSGVAAFLVYKLAVLVGFRLLRANQNGMPSNTRLLLLRVFALGKRSERMFDLVTKHWRHIGSVQLTAGPDLATTTVQPHEFLEFLSGKLARRFINGKGELDRRMAEMDMNPDFDGRFRVNNFFCYDDTWEMVLSRLVRESDVVLMDLRGFSTARHGCIRELNELINVVPVQRVVLVVDETTNLAILEQTLRQSWIVMLSTSPNATGPSKVLRLFQVNSRDATPVSQLISELCASAELPPDFIPNEPTAILAGISGAVQGEKFPIDREIFHIGAAPDNNLIINRDDYVSGHHACLRYRQGALSIVDQRSKNGTFVNDNRLRDAPLTVKAGDKIRMGKATIEVAWIKTEDENLVEAK